jgi:hypothetical protein
MPQELSKIRALYRRLIQAMRTTFPKVGEKLTVRDKHGVYVLYGPRGTALHVGRTVRGKRGLYQRLNNHLHGSSSFTQQHLDGKGAKLRGTHSYAFVEISHARTRALVEALAIGTLCPKHLGLGENAA